MSVNLQGSQTRTLSLVPVQAFGKPLIIDCVGPLPHCEAEGIYLLTVVCQSTRYPAAYCTITMKSVVKMKTLFISILAFFKLYRVVKVFIFRAEHTYQGQSQGVLEQFHQML